MAKIESKTSIKVSIIDDHPMVISGLMNMLKSFNHIHILSTFSNGETLLEGLLKEQPDVLLMDIMMPGLQGDALTKIVKEKYPDIKVLAVTSFDTPGQIRNMMQSGCSGYLLKNTDLDILVEAIEKTFAGEEFIEPGLKEQLIQSMLRFKEKGTLNPNTDKVVLTRREKEILQLIVQEYSNQQIAEMLFISMRTVENHRFNLQQKLCVKNMIGLIKVAIQMGLV